MNHLLKSLVRLCRQLDTLPHGTQYMSDIRRRLRLHTFLEQLEALLF